MFITPTIAKRLIGLTAKTTHPQSQIWCLAVNKVERFTKQPNQRSGNQKFSIAGMNSPQVILLKLRETSLYCT